MKTKGLRTKFDCQIPAHQAVRSLCKTVEQLERRDRIQRYVIQQLTQLLRNR